MNKNISLILLGISFFSAASSMEQTADLLSETDKELAKETYINFTKKDFLDVQDDLRRNLTSVISQNPGLSESRLFLNIRMGWEKELKGSDDLKKYPYEELTSLNDGQYYLLHNFEMGYDESELRGSWSLYKSFEKIKRQSPGFTRFHPEMIGGLNYNSSKKLGGLYIEHIDINNPYRGKGLGQTMIKHFIDFAANKTTISHLEVNCASLASINAFQRCGFYPAPLTTNNLYRYDLPNLYSPSLPVTAPVEIEKVRTNEPMLRLNETKIDEKKQTDHVAPISPYNVIIRLKMNNNVVPGKILLSQEEKDESKALEYVIDALEKLEKGKNPWMLLARFKVKHLFLSETVTRSETEEKELSMLNRAIRLLEKSL